MVDRKYRRLFSSSFRRRKPGPQGPCAERIAAIVEWKRRNPKARLGTHRAADLGLEFGAWRREGDGPKFLDELYSYPAKKER